MDSSELYSSDSDNTDGFDATEDMYHQGGYTKLIPVIISFLKLKARIMPLTYVFRPACDKTSFMLKYFCESIFLNKIISHLSFLKTLCCMSIIFIIS